jgi:hypothetical protein
MTVKKITILGITLLWLIERGLASEVPSDHPRMLRFNRKQARNGSNGAVGKGSGRGLYNGKGSEGGPHSGKGSEGGLYSGKGSGGGLYRGKGSEGGHYSGKGSEGGLNSGKGSEGGPHSGKGSEGGLHSGKGSKGGPYSGKGSEGGPYNGKGSKGEGGSGKGSTGGGTPGKGGHSTTAGPTTTGVSAPPTLSELPSAAPTISESPSSNADDNNTDNGPPIVCDDPPVGFSTPFGVNAETMIDLNLLDPALNQLYEEIAVFKEFGILNEDIDFIGSSINSLIGREGMSGIAAALDLRYFVDDAAARHGGSFVNASVLATELACIFDADKVFSHSSQFCGDGVPEYPVTVKSEGDTITVTFCMGMNFARSTTLNSYGLLSSIEDCIELETASKVSVTSTLEFSARLTINTLAPQQPLIEIGLTEASVELKESRPDIELYVGLLGLKCPSERTTATASAKFALSYCKGTCDQQVIGRQVNSMHPYYLEATGKYAILGNCELLDMFPGIDDDFAVSFEIIAEEIYAPKVNVSLEPKFTTEDFTKFCPSDVPYLLRTLDSTFGWTTGNEEMQRLVPFTDTSLKKTLAPETKLVDQLLRHFLKVQDFDRRVPRSLVLAESDREPNRTQIPFVPANETLEFFFITSDLNVDTGNVDALRELAKVNNGACVIEKTEEELLTPEKFKRFLKNSIGVSCDVTPCDLSDCRFDEDTEDYLCSGKPDCDVVVDTIQVLDDKDTLQNRVILASVGSKNVSFIGLYVNKNGKGPFKTQFAFPLNLPVSPGFVPRFRTFNDLATRIKLAISDGSSRNRDVKVDFKYWSEGQPSQISVSVELDRTINKNVEFRPPNNTLGNLTSIRVEDDSVVVLQAEAHYKENLTIILAPNVKDKLYIIGSACDGSTDSLCDLAPLSLKVEYSKTDGSETKASLTVAGSVNGSPLVVLQDAFAANVAIVKTRTPDPHNPRKLKKPTSTLVSITFDQSIDAVKLKVPKNCYDPETYGPQKENNLCVKCDVLECGPNERVEFLKNSYGLQDQELRRKPFHIAIKHSSVDAVIDVNSEPGGIALVGIVDEVVDVATNLELHLSGQLNLEIVPPGGLMPFDDWLSKIAGIGERPDLFLEARMTISSNMLTGIVNALPPFEDMVEVNGQVVAVDDFSLENPTQIEVQFEIDFLPGIRKLQFQDVVLGLSQAWKVIVGEDTISSCSGGLLGLDIFSKQIPGEFDISNKLWPGCSFAF